jgi:hypothetical protein
MAAGTIGWRRGGGDVAHSGSDYRLFQVACDVGLIGKTSSRSAGGFLKKETWDQTNKPCVGLPERGFTVSNN